MAILPYWDADLSTAEVQRVAAKGAKAVSFTESPHASGLPSWHSDHWDNLLAATQDADMPLCLHFGSGGRADVAPDAQLRRRHRPVRDELQFTMTEMLLSPVFHKFPRLKVAPLRGWHRLDAVAARARRLHVGAPPPLHRLQPRCPAVGPVPPAHLRLLHLRRDRHRERHRIGVDNIMFESDYPHSDSNWPSSRACSRRLLADVPDAEARKIAEDNTRHVFNFPRS